MLVRLKLSLGLATLLLAAACAAQQPDTSVADAVASLSSRSAFIVVAEVTAIRRDHDVVSIDLRVDQTLKGTPSPTVTLREWAGLWASGVRRYQLGQRAVFFLLPPSAAGLSSPVDDAEGILPLLPTSDPASPSVDLRRLQTRLRRDPGTPLATNPAPLPLTDLASCIPAPEVVPQPPHPRPAPPSHRPLPVWEFPIHKQPETLKQLDAPQ